MDNKNPELRTPNPEPVILSIETSCDETAVAVTEGYRILSSLVSSQVKEHAPYGGVVPELASRKHVTALNFLIDRALEEAQVDFDRLTAIAIAGGPGLVGALVVGMAAAKTLSLALEVPLINVNHVEAHIFSVLANDKSIEPPFLCLIVSGGHTILASVKSFGVYEILGQTLDDAAGEAFDKVAKTLGLPYPGGPAIESASKTGEEDRYKLPRPLLKSGDFNFSFSGLKTAVIYLLRDLKARDEDYRVEDMAASFQKAVADVLTSKVMSAAKQFHFNKVAMVGGVSANAYLRNYLTREAKDRDIELFFPVKDLSTDNAAMVGLAANYYYKNKKFSNLFSGVNPNWQLIV